MTDPTMSIDDVLAVMDSYGFRCGDPEADVSYARRAVRAAFAELAELRKALRDIDAVMGPKPAPCCQGCEAEWTEALSIVYAALGEPSRYTKPAPPKESEGG